MLLSTNKPVLPSDGRFLFRLFKQQSKRSLINPRIVLRSFHAVRLPGPGLSVGEDADVEAVNQRLDERRHFREHFRLRRRGGEYAIDLEGSGGGGFWLRFVVVGRRCDDVEAAIVVSVDGDRRRDGCVGIRGFPRGSR